MDLDQADKRELIYARQEPFLRYSLAELMGGVTVVAVCCALWKLHAAVGFFATIVLLPGTPLFIHAMRFCRKMRVPITAAECGWSFCYSCLIGLLAVVAYFISVVMVLFIGAVWISPRLMYQMPVSSAVALITAAIICLPVPLTIMFRLRLRPGLRVFRDGGYFTEN